MPLLTTNGGPFLPPLFVVALLWLSAAIGRRLLVWLGASGESSDAERLMVAVALGAGALQFVPVALGAAGALTTRSVRIAIVVIAVIAARDVWAIAASAWSQVRRARPTRSQAAWVVVLLPAIAGAFLLALVPTFDPDGLGYHLMVPKRWFASGSLDYLPTYAYSNGPMGVEMLFATALAFVGDAGAKCLHFSLGILGAVGLVLAGRRLHGSTVGWAAAALFLVGPAAAVDVLGSAYIEGAVAFAVIAGTLAWLIWLQSRQQGWLRCAALLAGVAVSFKITAALFPMALGGLTLLAIFADTPGERRARTAAALSGPTWTLVPLVLLPVVPWWIRAALVTGNPFFPLLVTRIPSRDLSPASAAAFDQFFRYWNWGSSLGPAWTLERRRLLLVGAAILVVVFAVYLFMRSRSSMARGAVVTIAAVALAQLYAVGLYTRLWIPLAAVVMLPLTAAVGRALSGRLILVTVLVATLVLSGLHLRREIGTVSGGFTTLARTAAGVDDRREFLLRQLPLFPLYDYANRQLPIGAGILLTHSCMGFYLDRSTLCDETIQDSLRWTVLDEFVGDLRRLGVTHVLAPRIFAEGVAPPPVGPTSLGFVRYERERALLKELLGRHARVLATAADQALYALDSDVTNGPAAIR